MSLRNNNIKTLEIISGWGLYPKSLKQESKNPELLVNLES